MNRRLAALAAVVAALAALLVPGTQAQAAPAHRLLLAGDSITQGSAGDYTWRYRLWKKLAATAPGAVTFVGPRTGVYDTVGRTQNRGFYADRSFTARHHAALWGTTFEAQLPRIRSQVADSRATTLVVLLGFNDIAWLGRTPAQTIAALEGFIGRARQANPRISVVVGQLTKPWDPWSGQVLHGPAIDAYNRALPGVVSRLGTASSRIVVAPTASGWAPKRHTYDGTHPNPTGETLIAQRVSEGLAGLGIGARTPNIYATTAWAVRGPTPQVSAGVRSAGLRWDRVPTGATSMYVQLRTTAPAASAWRQLPYPVSGDAFTAGGLASGATYQFRVAPSKGFLTGLPGSAAAVRVR